MKRSLFALALALLLLSLGQPATAQEDPPETLRVATKALDPFVFLDENGARPTGYSVDTWDIIANDIGVETEWIEYESVGEIIAAVENGDADVAIAGISITPEREQSIDFTHSYFDAGLQVYTAPGGGSNPIKSAFSLIFNREAIVPILLLLVLVAIVSHGVWLTERNHNPAFPRGYKEGIGEAFWWSTVNVITGGEGVKEIRRGTSRLLAILWMVVGLLVMAYVTARITTVLTVNELESSITGVDDLAGATVVTVQDTIAADWLAGDGIAFDGVASIDVALDRVANGDADAVVFDSPVLAYQSTTAYDGQLQPAGAIFEPDKYGIALPQGSELREQIDQVVLAMNRDGRASDLYQAWFGGTR